MGPIRYSPGHFQVLTRPWLERSSRERCVVDAKEHDRLLRTARAQTSQVLADASTLSTELSPDETVTLRQRAWPLVEMMKRAQLENAHIVWGV